jgi:hypothetical protein
MPVGEIITANRHSLSSLETAEALRLLKTNAVDKRWLIA